MYLQKHKRAQYLEKNKAAWLGRRGYRRILETSGIESTCGVTMVLEQNPCHMIWFKNELMLDDLV